MSNIREIHRQAMEIADQAFIARRKGLDEEAIPLFQDAYQMEFEAAQQTTKEPSRSILYRSAATLAFHGQLLRESEKAIALGLSGNPNPETANELRELFERINFQRHLSLQGLQLNSSEIQMSIIGNAIAQGMARIEDVVARIEDVKRLIIRTAQRINQKPFSKMAKSKDYGNYSLFMSPPRVGSFAVTLHVGQPQQEVFPEIDDRESVIDEVIFNLSLLNENRIDELQNAIPEKPYFESFLGIAKNLAPDGDKVRMVGLTAFRRHKEISVDFSIVSKDIKVVMEEFLEDPNTEQESREEVQLTGELVIGDAISNKIKVKDDKQKSHTIEVSEAIAEDVVRPYFGSRVVVDAIRLNKKRLLFRDINPAEV